MIIAAAPSTALDPPITKQAEDIDKIWDLNLYLGLAVVAFVALLVLFVTIRYRRRDENLPSQTRYSLPVQITYTLVPLAIIGALVAITFVSVSAIEDVDKKTPDLVVDVTAFQWQWAFAYPEAGVEVVGGPADDTPTLVLPADSTVQFNLESLDVVHSFWITAFRFKHDIIPGSPSTFSVEINDQLGDFPNAGVCAEYCGLDHAFMRFGVQVLPPDQFETWLGEQRSATEDDS